MKYSLPVPSNLVDIRPVPFHKTHKSMKHCVDFALPIGTPIRAVADGVVIYTEDGFDKSYSDPKYSNLANCVEIRHPDGCVSMYVHLKYLSIRVKKEQEVRRGQVIALSGDTGYATYPHLHFGLYDAKGNNIPIEFTG